MKICEIKTFHCKGIKMNDLEETKEIKEKEENYWEIDECRLRWIS